MRRLARAFALASLIAAPAAAQAPDAPPFLFLNQERLLTGSATGQALLAEEAAAREDLRAEAREIDRRFEEEERALTERRATMEPGAFRPLADAFDERVVRARREQDERSTALVLEFEQRRRQFYQEVAPILVSLLSRYDAHAIFDESSVLLADQSLNITDAVIAEIDAAAAAEDGVGAASDAPSGDVPSGAPAAPQDE
ncbi:hypothetical protein BH23PSE1_BH23PSE1_05460 [soil metagenome]